MFYSWLSVEIAIVNKDFFKKISDPGTLNPHHHQYVIFYTLGHLPRLQKFHQNPFITNGHTDRIR